jgi:FkbM family methyltransferase
MWVEGVYDVPYSRAFDAESEFRRAAEEGRPLAVDLGAHVGLASLRLVSRYPGVQLVAVEPAPPNLALLRHNLAVVPDAIIISGAIADTDGYIGLSVPNEFSQDSYMTAGVATGTSRVRAVKLATALGNVLDSAVPFFLKVDIEGAESTLFADDLPWRFPIIAIEPHEWLLPGEQPLSRFLEGHLNRDRDLLVGVGGVLFSVASRSRPTTNLRSNH